MQPQADIQDNYALIINSGEQLYQLAEELNIVEFEKKLPEYTRIIEQYFVALDENEITNHDFENMKQIMSKHKMITNLLSSKKEDVSKDLKQLHVGKEMQNTYPQTIL